MQEMIERYLTEEQRMMRETIRAFVDNEVTPFIRRNWQLEWDMKPENRPSVELLQGVDKIGVRTLGVPEEFGGTPLDPKTEVQTYAMIAEEISRGDSGLAERNIELSRPAGYAGPDGHPLQRNRRRPFHEQWRDRVRRLCRAKRPLPRSGRGDEQGRRLFPAGQDHRRREATPGPRTEAPKKRSKHADDNAYWQHVRTP